MSLSTPTIVIVPGALHVPEIFSSFCNHLHAAGYATEVISLPSVGASPAVHNFDPDVAAVRAVVTEHINRGEEVVVLMHSYGGVPGTEALRHLGTGDRRKAGEDGGVMALLYMAALILREGGTVMGLGNVDPDPPAGEAKPTLSSGLKVLEDGTAIVVDPLTRFFGDLPPEEADRVAAMLKPHSVGTFTSGLTYEAYRDIPAAYLICALDRALNPHIQARMAKEAGTIMVETIDASHSPFISQPKRVIEFIGKVVAKVRA